ncbi:hypothetical protein [Dietzia natronolimnaea]|uniref:hypothetical protein n=1 Tax=Dietzia natronolimnaea TaxID=161920 RepID=UPI0015F9AD4B|nr:hypothetical protein [Dietzia natronolimnaea]MBB1036563.1 hypothetical protein [Dietzia natronolimnaea]
MNSTTTITARGAVAAAAALALAVGLAPAATAQIPGGNASGFVVRVDDPSMSVTTEKELDPVTELPVRVVGTITNTTNATFRCEVPQFNIGGPTTALGFGQVSTAATAAEVYEYYRTGVFTGPAVTNTNGGLVALGSVLDLFPAGSAVGSAETDTRAAHQTARVQGRTGDPRVGGALQFNVPAESTVNYTADLQPSATGDRGDWRASAIFMCRNTSTNDWFLFIGLEDIVDPNPIPESTGSLGSGSIG